MSNYLKKKLIVIMEYQGRKVIENIAQYKQIKYIKEVAKNAFCILNPKISLYYQHKDITENEEKLVGDYFKRKNQITIKIVSGKVNQGNNINNNKKEGKNTSDDKLVKEIKKNKRVNSQKKYSLKKIKSSIVINNPNLKKLICLKTQLMKFH